MNGHAPSYHGYRFRQLHDALHRSLAHTSFHVDQIVYVAKSMGGETWRSLSIPPGGSTAYNQNPTLDRPDGHAAELDRSADQ